MSQLLTIDTETTGLDMYNGDTVTHCNYRWKGKNYIVPKAQFKKHLPRLRRAIRESDHVVMQYSPFDLCVCEQDETLKTLSLIDLPPQKLFDTCGAAHYFRPDMSHSLEDMTRYFLKKPHALKPKAKHDWASGKPPSTEYMEFDLERTEEIAHTLLDGFHKFPQILDGFREVQGIAQCAAKMRERGLTFNTDGVKDLYAFIYRERKKAKNALHKAGLPKDLKPTQTRKIAQWIEDHFDDYLPRTKNDNPSIAQDALANYIPLFEGTQHFLNAFAAFQKIEAAREHAVRFWEWQDSSTTGMIHPAWNPFGPITFRFSCSDPNTQNISKREEKLGPQFRALFKPFEHKQWMVSIDYSSIEMKIFAHYTNDQNLIRIMNDPEFDPHTETAKIIFNTHFPTKQQRTVAKHFNFGILYGAGNETLCATINKMAGTTFKSTDVYTMRKRWERAYPAAKRFMWENINQVKEYGFISNAYNYRIPVHKDRKYVGTNYKIQSTVSGMINRAMIALEKANIPVLAIIHDELWLGRFRTKRVAKEAATTAQHIMKLDQPMFKTTIETECEIWGKAA